MIPNLICHWTFEERAGEPRTSRGPHAYALQEVNGPIAQVAEGPVSGHAAELRQGQYFTLPRAACPALDLHGAEAQVSLVAWVRRRPKVDEVCCEAIAGMWNETEAKRQYCLFLDLKIHDSSDQVCGHVSSVGGPTPGNMYCMDAAIGATPVPHDRWQCVAFSYDSQAIRAYLNGTLDARADLNPYAYPGGLFEAGPDGSDFTVGSVNRSGVMGNFFVGQLGGLAVFDRALHDEEMRQLATAPWHELLPV